MKSPSIRREFLAALLVTSVTALCLVGVSLLCYGLVAYKKTMSRNLSVLAKTIAANSTALLVFDDQKVAQEILSALRAEPDVRAACLYTEDGVVYSTYPPGTPASAFPVHPGPDGMENSGIHLTLFEPVVQAEGRVGTLYIDEDLRGMYNRFGVSVFAIVLVMIASTGVALALSGMFEKRLSRPILELAAIARQISEQKDFSVRAVYQERVEEIVALNRAFNKMLEELHARELSLKQHAERLEARVVERTSSLEETTRQLYDFCYSVAHDLKAPIRAQSAYAQMLIDDFGERLGMEGTEFARRIVDAAERQSRLVTDLLSHVSVGRSDLPLAPVDLQAVAEQVRRDLTVDIGRRGATVDISGVHAQVMANPASLHLMVLNLFSNAIKFVPSTRRPEVNVRTEMRGQFVRFLVQDNGLGIAEKHIHRLFEMFQRLHTRQEYPGTGIGLAIVKRAAERMGGKVGVESREGEGSVFWIELPAANGAAYEAISNPRNVPLEDANLSTSNPIR